MRPDERGDLGIGDGSSGTQVALRVDVERDALRLADTEEGPARIRNHHTPPFRGSSAASLATLTPETSEP